MRKVVIGLEVHCEVMTHSKNFSASPNEYTMTPNIHVSPVDLGLPGILPVANKEAVRKALKTAMALHCENPDEVIFDRKNYFYPDLPKGYQITQVTKPCGVRGYLDFYVEDKVKRVEIHQLHLEEDTASLEHYNNFSLIDYNRSGIPLMEIVTEPCIESSDEAVAFLETLRSVFLYLEVSEAASDKGQMRCDVNISLKEEGETKLGTKVEMKNINSFSNVHDAIEYEIKRQNEVLDHGEKVVQETRRFDDTTGKTFSMREKVDAIDYKYFVEPNIPPVKITKEFLEEIRQEIPPLAFSRMNKYMEEYGLSRYDATILVKEKKISDYFEEVIKNGASYKSASSWVISLVLASLNKLEISLEEFFLTPKMLADVINLVDNNKLSMDHGKKIIYQAIKEKRNPIEIIEENHLEKIEDQNVILNYAQEAIEENPEQVRQYVEEGKDYIANFFVGKVMQKSRRQADPKIALEMIKQELEKRKNR